MSGANFSLILNVKLKNTPIFDSLSKLGFRLIFDENLSLDFKTSSTGLIYIPKSSNEENTSSSEFRKKLVKLHNSYPNYPLQVLIDYSNKQLFNSIQEFAVIELKVQVIPVDSINELIQYIERLLLSESQEDKNPFLRDVNRINDAEKASNLFYNSLRLIPKIGEKNAKLILTKFKNLKSLANASYEELEAFIGSNSAKSVYDFFN